MLETAIGLERSQERLLEGVVGALATERPPEHPKHLGPVLLVEVLERGDRHALHHPLQTSGPADL